MGMNEHPLPMTELLLPPLSLTGWSVRVLAEADAPVLQAFFYANPEYFRLADGQAAGPEEAIDTLRDAPPAGFSWSSKGVFGFFGPDGRLCAMAQVIADLLAESVWHIGLFIVATDRHGKGDAQVLVHWLEALALSRQANWMRLGVLLKNPRAGRFWEKAGYHVVRLRLDAQVGDQCQEVAVRVKPLRGGAIDDYLAQVPRDRPEA